jgi:hypothetical protein
MRGNFKLLFFWIFIIGLMETKASFWTFGNMVDRSATFNFVILIRR